MKSSIGASTSRSSSGSSMSFVRQQFRKGYEIPLLPYQKLGILSKVLWPSKNQIIRIIPGYDAKTGEVFRQNVNCSRYSSEGDPTEYLSDTFYKATVVSRFGGTRSPFIIDYEPDSADERMWGGDTVLRNFIRDIQYACSGKGGRRNLHPTQEWRTWTGIGPSATLSFDKQSLLMQALVFHVNGSNNKDLDSDNDLVDEDGDIKPLLAVVAIDHKQSMNNLLQALVDPSNPGEPLDAITNNKYGGLAELDGNKLFLNSYTEPVTQHYALRPSVQAPGAGWTPTPYPLDDGTVHALWHPWEDILQYMTAEEQLRLCAEEYGADTVNYVIGSNPKFSRLRIPEDIAAVGIGKYGNGGTITLTSASSPRQVAKPQHGLTFGPAKQQASGYKPGATLGSKPAVNLSGIPAESNVNLVGIMNSVNAIRDAARPKVDQASEAASLLDEPLTPFDKEV